MTVAQAQRDVSSVEFSEWIAFYTLEVEMADPNRKPTPDEIGDKLAAAFALHNAKVAANDAGKVKR